jgi:hypothetical protein
VFTGRGAFFLSPALRHLIDRFLKNVQELELGELVAHGMMMPGGKVS